MTTAERKPKALVDADKKIVELEAKLKSAESIKDMYAKESRERGQVIDGIHDILDDLGIRGWRDDNDYKNDNNRIPLAVRLFAWAMSLQQPNKKEVVK